MKNVVTTVRIAIVATAVLLAGAGATISSATSPHDSHGTSSTITVADPDPNQPSCIGCWE